MVKKFMKILKVKGGIRKLLFRNMKIILEIMIKKIIINFSNIVKLIILISYKIKIKIKKLQKALLTLPLMKVKMMKILKMKKQKMKKIIIKI